MPEIVTGIRVGFSLALIGTLLGEMFAYGAGCGLRVPAPIVHT